MRRNIYGIQFIILAILNYAGKVHFERDGWKTTEDIANFVNYMA